MVEKKSMSSTIQRSLNRTVSKFTTSFPTPQVSNRLQVNISASLPKVGIVLVPLGLSAVIALSVMNEKLFLRELLLGSFIIRP